MKTRNIFITIATFILFLSTTQAQFFMLKTVDEFESHYGSSCLAANDGYNKYDVVDGKVIFDEEKEYKVLDEEEELWTCKEYNNISTSKMMTIQTTSFETTAVTTSISLEDESNLSDNDQAEYDYIKNKLDTKYLEFSENFMTKYDNLLEGYSDYNVNKINNIMTIKINEIINTLLNDYPQDTILPENINNIYLTLNLIKLEIIK